MQHYKSCPSMHIYTESAHSMTVCTLRGTIVDIWEFCFTNSSIIIIIKGIIRKNSC